MENGYKPKTLTFQIHNYLNDIPPIEPIKDKRKLEEPWYRKFENSRHKGRRK